MSSFLTPLINGLFGDDTIEEGGFVDSAIDWGTKAVTAWGVSKLLYDPPEKKQSTPAAAQPNAGIKIQLAPATKNYVNVFYGTTWMKPVITDAKISSDNKTMWYVLAYSEVPDNGTITFDSFMWGDKKINFDGSDPTKVASFTDSYGVSDSKVAGYMYIYTYGNGSANPLNSSIDARTLLADSAIASAKWGSSDLMTKTAFVVVKVIYNQEVGLTGLGSVSAKMTNSIVGPGDVLYDYFTNERYGCGIPVENLNQQTFSDLNAYSAELITYTPHGGGTQQTAPRYTINGMIDVSQNCFSNLQYIATACDSWIQWNEILGKWGVVINKAYNQAAGSQTAKTLSQLFNLNDDVIIGNIDFNPTDLNSSYNKIEMSFYDINATSNQAEILIELDTADRNPNEPTNPMKMNMPLVNNYVQANYLATRKLIQNREDLVVSLNCDYSGIQIEAGDLVRINSDKFKWVDKVFRVSQVTEGKDASGFLSVNLTLLEYNHQVYENIDISDFVPEGNTGIGDPTLIDIPLSPAVVLSTITSGTIYALEVTATVPSSGLVTDMLFYTGTTANTDDHVIYKTTTSDKGNAFTPGASTKITVTDLKPNSINITNITNASSAIITTSAAHGLTTGDIVFLYQINGMNELNGSRPTITVLSPTTFSVGYDTTVYNTYTSGGIVQRPVYFSVKASSDGVLSKSSPAVSFRWPGPTNLTGGVNSFAIAASAVTDTTYTGSRTPTIYTPPLTQGTLYTLTSTQVAPITLNVGDAFTIDCSIAGYVGWYTGNGSASTVVTYISVSSRAYGSNNWQVEWNTAHDSGFLSTGSFVGETSYLFYGSITGLTLYATQSGTREFCIQLSHVLGTSTSATNYPTGVEVDYSTLRVTRLRK